MFKLAILSITPTYSNVFRTVSPSSTDTELTDSETLHLNFSDLLKRCETVYSLLSVTTEQSEAVEEETRKKWPNISLNNESCCHKDPDLPSQSLSLIKLICYPDSLRFSLRAIQWGCDHEKHALKFYEDMMCKKHTDMLLKESGFVISTDHPFIGVSPNGTAKCDCCGEGCVEVKCLFVLRMQ